jgi:hypothetical protein
MLLELGKFGSLLLALLCLCFVFHVAFLVQEPQLSNRLVDAAKMLLVAGGICWGSGWIFHRWDLTVGIKNSSIASTLPMKVFWWALLLLFVLFGLSAYFEYYYLPLRGMPLWS